MNGPNPVTTHSVRISVGEDTKPAKPDWRIYNGREISFVPRTVAKAQKFLLATVFKLKSVISGYMARSAAVQAPQREKPAVSAPRDFTHIAGAGMSAAECRNPLLTVPVQTVAAELVRKPSIDPRRVAELVADNPLLQKAAPTIVSQPAAAKPVEKSADNGFFELSVDVPVYKSVGPLRGSFVEEAYKRYEAKMSAFRFNPIKQESEERAYAKAETQRLEAMRGGISARIGAEG